MEVLIYVQTYANVFAEVTSCVYIMCGKVGTINNMLYINKSLGFILYIKEQDPVNRINTLLL